MLHHKIILEEYAHEAEFMSDCAAQNALADMLPSQTPNPNLPNPDNNQALGASFLKGI